MDIKEITQKLAPGYWKRDQWNIEYFDSVGFAEAIISTYKAELLNEVGEPVAYMTTDEEGSASMLFFDQAEALKYSGDDEPVKLFTEPQLLAVLAKKNEEIERWRLDCHTYHKEMVKRESSIIELRQQLQAAQEEWNQCSGLLDDAHRSIEMLEYQLATAEQRVAEACSRTVYVQADQIKKLTAERDAALARLSEERDIWDRMLGDAADKFAHLEREIDDCLYILDALWDKQCDKIVTQKWVEILIRNKRVTGASSAEDSSEPTSSE